MVAMTTDNCPNMVRNQAKKVERAAEESAIPIPKAADRPTIEVFR